MSFLNTTIYSNPYIVFDLWSILHFVLFFIIGKLRLLSFKVVLIGMILFEVIEFILARFTPFFQEGLKDTFTDLLINIFGFILGGAL